MVNVTEKPTGNLLIGAGYSSAERLTFTAQIKQENVFGSGNYLGLELNTSKYNRTVVLSTVDPYWTVDGISRAIDLYYRTNKPINAQGATYELATPGATAPHPSANERNGKNEKKGTECGELAPLSQSLPMLERRHAIFYNYHQPDVDNILNEFELRGARFFDDTIRANIAY